MLSPGVCPLGIGARSRTDNGMLMCSRTSRPVLPRTTVAATVAFPRRCETPSRSPRSRRWTTRTRGARAQGGVRPPDSRSPSCRRPRRGRWPPCLRRTPLGPGPARRRSGSHDTRGGRADVHDAQDSTNSIDPPGGAAPRGRFAFLVHPLAPVRQDMARLARPLGLLPDRLFEAAFAHLPVRAPQVATYTAEDRPDQLLGRVYGVPLSPRQLLHAPRPMVHDRIDRAVDQAVEAGATVVGLGGLTAPAVSGGEALRDRTDIGGTNGNAFNAAMTAEDRKSTRLNSSHANISYAVFC